RPMSVAERDLRWTEWVRKHHDEIVADLQSLESGGHSLEGKRTLADHLRATWVMWILTSTVREIRDQATRTLYWLGRGDPAALFNLTLEGLAINDPYVYERLLAASYGVAMAHPFSRPAFDKALQDFLAGLRYA